MGWGREDGGGARWYEEEAKKVEPSVAMDRVRLDPEEDRVRLLDLDLEVMAFGGRCDSL